MLHSVRCSLFPFPSFCSRTIVTVTFVDCW